MQLEFFQMGKMHKEIAKFLLQSSEDENLVDEDIVRVSIHKENYKQNILKNIHPTMQTPN